MIYIFGGLLIISFIKQRDVLLEKKMHMGLFLVLSVCGIAIGAVYNIFPYIPSIAYVLEKYLK